MNRTSKNSQTQTTVTRGKETGVGGEAEKVKGDQMHSDGRGLAHNAIYRRQINIIGLYTWNLTNLLNNGTSIHLEKNTDKTEKVIPFSI